MIQVKIGYRAEGRECFLRVEGHAGQGEVGHDLVCASASILAYTVAQIVKAMDAHKDFAEPPVLKMDSGDAEILCRAKDDYIFAEMVQDFFVIKTGYELLAHNYPQYVQLTTDVEA